LESCHLSDLEVSVFVSRFAAALLLLLLTGCSAQTPDASSADAALNRRIELQLRSRYGRIPTEAKFTYGERKPSEMTGYDLLPVTLSVGEQKQTLEFLISKDNKTLARLEKFDVAKLPAADLDLKGRPVRGNPDAKVTIINFDDFQCPYCAMMHERLVHEVLPTYGDKLKIIYKDFPLGNHPWAVRAAVNANCIGSQSGKAYWDYADKVHGSLREISENDKGRRPLVESQSRLDELAQEIGKRNSLDSSMLNACLKKQDDSAVKASLAEGEHLAIDSTPTLFVNGERVAGAIPFEDFQVVLDRALVAAGVTPPEKTKPAPSPVPSANPQEKK
jgi:protein-disulfide isomerase